MPLNVELECELAVRALRDHGLKDPQALLDATIKLVRQNFTLQQAVMNAVTRIAELQIEAAMAQLPSGDRGIKQEHYEMAAMILNDMNIDMP